MVQLSPNLDVAQTFQIEGQAVRGRAASLMGSGMTSILARHAYTPAVSLILAEALILAALAAQSLKFEGRVLVQAEGDGPLSMLVAEVSSRGHMRGYAKQKPETAKDLAALSDMTTDADGQGEGVTIADYFGADGRLSLIILQDDSNLKPYQGVVDMRHASLAECAQAYFLQSEQIPTRLQISVGELKVAGQDTRYVGRGLMMQQIAADAARGQTADDWVAVQALFNTLGHAELADPDIATEEVLYRLFHESGVRVEQSSPLVDSCTCSKERLVSTLQNMGAAALVEVFDGDKTISINCEFCARVYSLHQPEVGLR